jgi:hypothetical protein
MSTKTGQSDTLTLWCETWWADCFECDREWSIEVPAGEGPEDEQDCPYCGGREAVIFTTWAMPGREKVAA